MRLGGIALPGGFPSDSSPEEEADMHPLSRTPTHSFMLKLQEEKLTRRVSS